MSFPKTATLLLCGAFLLAGCNTQYDQPAAEPADTPPPDATPMPPPPDTTVPTDEPDPSMADDLPTTPNPPPQEPQPPTG